MLDYIVTDVLFDPIYEFHDQYKLALEVKYLYGVRVGRILRSEVELNAVNAAVTTWLELERLIKEIEGDDSEPSVPIHD
jgi:hypothetical protein